MKVQVSESAQKRPLKILISLLYYVPHYTATPSTSKTWQRRSPRADTK